MSISYVGSSANTSSPSGGLTIVPPPTQTGDILLLATSARDNTKLGIPGDDASIGVPMDWIPIMFSMTHGTKLTANLYYKRAVGVEAPFSITHSGGLIVGNVAVFRGVFGGPGESPLGFASAQYNSVSNCISPSITPTGPNCLYVSVVHDSDCGVSSNPTNATLGSLTKAFDNVSGKKSSGISVSLSYKVSPVDTDSGLTTTSLSNGPDNCIGTSLFLLPA